MDIQGDVMIQPEEVVPVFDLVANHEKGIAMIAAYEAEQAKIGQPQNDILEEIEITEEIEDIEDDFFDTEEEENEYEEE
jgi:hypothetical protein